MYEPDVLALSVISCILSIIGGAVIFASFWALPEIRNFQSRRLVICLTVADSITATAYLMSVIDYAIPYNYNNNKTNNFQYLNDSIPETAVCKVQSFFTTYSSLVSFFMTSIIAVYIFDSVVNRTDRLGNTKWLLVFNIVSWVIPGCIVVSALAYDVLGSDEAGTERWSGTGPWCWISTTARYRLFWMLVTGKGWEIACYLITMSSYVLLKIYLILRHRRERFHQIHASLRNEDKNFLYVWFLLYLLRVWGTVRFFLFITLDPAEYALYMDTVMLVLLRLQAVGDPAQALVNCFLFCFLDKTVFQKLKQFICCRRQSTQERRRLLSSSPSCDDAYNHDQTNSVEPLPDTELERKTSGYSSVASTRSELLQLREPVYSLTENQN